MTEKEQEINIFDLFYILFKSKMLLISIILVCTLGGYFYYKSLPLKVLSEYNIYPILKNDQIKYNQYNSLKQKDIDSNYLKYLFVEQINSYEDIRSAIINSDLVNRDDYSSQIEYNDAIKSYVLKFKLESLESEVKLIYIDTFSDIDNNQIISLFDEIIYSANENVRKTIIYEFNNEMEAIERSNKYEKEELENRIKNLKEKFLLESSNRIIFLEEQAKMARHLGVKEHLGINNFQNSENKDSSITNIVLEDEEDSKQHDEYYLKGYDAIEKEILIMKQRSTADPYIEEIGDYLLRINEINQDLSVERAKNFLEISPIYSNDNFKSVRLSTNYFLKIKVFNEMNKILLISFFIGLFTGSLFIILRYFINKKSIFKYF